MFSVVRHVVVAQGSQSTIFQHFDAACAITVRERGGRKSCVYNYGSPVAILAMLCLYVQDCFRKQFQELP